MRMEAVQMVSARAYALRECGNACEEVVTLRNCITKKTVRMCGYVYIGRQICQKLRQA